MSDDPNKIHEKGPVLVKRRDGRITEMFPTGKLDGNNREIYEGKELEDSPVLDEKGEIKIDPTTEKALMKRGYPGRILSPEDTSPEVQRQLREEKAALEATADIDQSLFDTQTRPNRSAQETAIEKSQELVAQQLPEEGEVDVSPTAREEIAEDMAAEATPEVVKAPPETKEETLELVAKAGTALEYRLKSFSEQKGFSKDPEQHPTKLAKIQGSLRDIESHAASLSAHDLEVALKSVSRELENDVMASYDPFDPREWRRLGDEHVSTHKRDKEMQGLSVEVQEIATGLTTASNANHDVKKLVQTGLNMLRDEIIPRVQRGIPVQDLLYDLSVRHMNSVNGQDDALRRSIAVLKTRLSSIEAMTK